MLTPSKSTSTSVLDKTPQEWIMAEEYGDQESLYDDIKKIVEEGVNVAVEPVEGYGMNYSGNVSVKDAVTKLNKEGKAEIKMTGKNYSYLVLGQKS